MRCNIYVNVIPTWNRRGSWASAVYERARFSVSPSSLPPGSARRRVLPGLPESFTVPSPFPSSWRNVAGAAALLCAFAALGIVAPSDAAFPDGGPLLAFTELQGKSSLLWAAAPETPARRRLLGAVAHREGYGPRVVPSPDGSWLAATVLPPDGADLEHDGRLLMLHAYDGASRLVLEHVNARGAPVWSPDGRSVAVKRLLPDGPELVTVEAATGAVVATAREPGAVDLFLVGWTPDGSTLYVATQTLHGFDLKALRTSQPQAPELIAPLADAAARDFRLSPDGRHLSYLAAGLAGRPSAFAVAVLDLNRPSWDRSGGKRFVTDGAPALGAIWQPQGRGLTLALVASDGRALQTLAADGSVYPARVPSPSGGYDVPLGWSPDGRFLAVRHLTGSDLQRLTGERLDILIENGGRATVEGAGPVSFAGWLPAPPP